MSDNLHDTQLLNAGQKSRLNKAIACILFPEAVLPVIKTIPKMQTHPKEQWEVFCPSTDPQQLKRPLFVSSVPAGFPSPADDYIETLLDLNEYLVSRPSATFYIRVSGESMTGAGIFAGDILVVDRSLKAKHGNIVIAVVDNELTVKRLYHQNGKIELHPENPTFPIITFHHGMELMIWGVVSGVTRKL
jgi:DNA polymerase V